MCVFLNDSDATFLHMGVIDESLCITADMNSSGRQLDGLRRYCTASATYLCGGALSRGVRRACLERLLNFVSSYWSVFGSWTSAVWTWWLSFTLHCNRRNNCSPSVDRRCAELRQNCREWHTSIVIPQTDPVRWSIGERCRRCIGVKKIV